MPNDGREAREVFDLFLGELEALEIPEIKIPDFRIPNWPRTAGTVTVNLGRRKCSFPEQSDKSGLLRLRRRATGVTFCIFSNGAIYVELTPVMEPSDQLYSTQENGMRHPSNLEKLQVLFLFQQFRGELLPRVIQQLRSDLADHTEAVLGGAKEALEPFLPYLVAEELAK